MNMRNLYNTFSVFVIICITLFTSGNAYGQVSGNVFLDVNNNGVKSNIGSGHHENGMHGLVVKAYNASGTRLDSTSCDANGNYSLPLANTFPIRLEFINPSNGFPAKRGAINAGNVQFLSAPSTTADYCVGYNSQQSTITNPFVVTSASSNGNATAAGVNEAGLRQNLFITPYNLDNTWKTGANYQNRWLGSIFGITFQKETRTLLLAAYLKRHAGFGPGGIDAIYKTIVQQNGDASQPQILLNLSNIGINVGANPRTVALPNDPTQPNSDLGVFGLIGKRGIGNIDLAENGKDIYITNLFENKIHRIDIGMPVKTSFTASDVTGTWSIAGPGLSNT